MVQCLGGICGTVVAHLMFDLAPLAIGTTGRSGPSQWFAEAVATFTLVLAILGGVRYAPSAIPWLVGLTITAAYWFTASTSFANPAVTLARGFTTTFAGIAINHVPAFVAAQLLALQSVPVCQRCCSLRERIWTKMRYVQHPVENRRARVDGLNHQGTQRCLRLAALKIFMFFFVGGLIGIAYESGRWVFVACSTCNHSGRVWCGCLRRDLASSAAQSHDADADAPLHPADQCVLEKDREQRLRARALFLLVQLGPLAQGAQADAGHGRRVDEVANGDGRPGRS